MFQALEKGAVPGHAEQAAAARTGAIVPGGHTAQVVLKVPGAQELRHVLLAAGRMLVVVVVKLRRGHVVVSAANKKEVPRITPDWSRSSCSTAPEEFMTKKLLEKCVAQDAPCRG